MIRERIGQCVLFEDQIARSKRFLPLTYTRPVSLLRTGLYTGCERLANFLPKESIVLHATPQLADATRDRHRCEVNRIDPAKRTLFLNARAFLSWQLAAALSRYEDSCAILSADGGAMYAAIFDTVPDSLIRQIERGDIVEHGKLNLRTHSTPITSFDSLWSMIQYNGQAIRQDVELTKGTGRFHGYFFNGEHLGVQVAKPANVAIHETALIGLGVILDATDGPIILQQGARVLPNAVIMGPAVIGENSLVKAGAKIYEGTTIGPTCKVGGEIENSIVLGYSNKQHDGYLGHSYLGEWVNLGADTNTSDLKNDYSNVKVYPENEEIDTGSMFVGLLMGDHSKSAINTQFNTGTVVGVCSNIFEPGFPPKFVPSFTWGGITGHGSYRIDKALDVARAVMSRRNTEILPSEEQVLRDLAKASA